MKRAAAPLIIVLGSSTPVQVQHRSGSALRKAMRMLVSAQP